MQRTALTCLTILALLASPAAALRYEPASLNASTRVDNALAVRDEAMQPLPNPDQPPTNVGDEPYVYMIDLAWVGRTAHLVVRNPHWDAARVRVVQVTQWANGSTSSSEEITWLDGGRFQHRTYPVGPDGVHESYLVVAAEEPMVVSARAFGRSYGHELQVREIDCDDSGEARDDGTPWGRACWHARHG